MCPLLSKIKEDFNYLKLDNVLIKNVTERTIPDWTTSAEDSRSLACSLGDVHIYLSKNSSIINCWQLNLFNLKLHLDCHCKNDLNL